MRLRDREISSKYSRRLGVEFARTTIGEVFAFLSGGIPSNWVPRESSTEASAVQSAIRNILEFAYSGRLLLEGHMPLEHSVAVLERCLNHPISISYGTI